MTAMEFRLSLDSQQLELLAAFHATDGLGELARLLAKDSSVISRRLQNLAETAPVLTKNNGRWQLTEMGMAVRSAYVAFAKELADITNEAPVDDSLSSALPAPLILINCQKAWLFGDTALSAKETQGKIWALLQHWRSLDYPIVHVRHLSANSDSAFHASKESAEFIDELRPNPGETIIDKYFASAFKETYLGLKLQAEETNHTILAGYTANDCISATARDSFESGLTPVVVSDGTMSLRLTSATGELIPDQSVHELILTNIRCLYGKVRTASELTALTSP